MTAARGAIYFNRSSGAGLEKELAELEKRAGEERLDMVELDEEVDVQADIRNRQNEGQRLFVAAGGDGTIHTVAQPLVRSSSVLGVLPLGTFNHFARDIEMPQDWREALDVVFGDEVRQVDVGEVNRIFFMNSIALGIYPKVMKQRERLRPNHGKWMAYALAVNGTLRRMPHVSMTLESPPHLEVVSSHMFFVSVSSYNLSEAGILAPRETLESGRLGVYWLPHGSRWQLIRAVARYLRGRASDIDGFRQMYVPGLRINVPSKRRLRVGIDGELYKLKAPLDVRVVPSGLQVKVPRQVLNEK
ncbi:MAG: NAD(+)/NADH kinase [Acidobacteria bacterium]|nr:NAD(+)/NADH kinase [Acidobacteriota bacterium]